MTTRSRRSWSLRAAALAVAVTGVLVLHYGSGQPLLPLVVIFGLLYAGLTIATARR